MTHYTLNAQYYQQFDADPEREVPGEGYGGWQTAAIDLAREHTGVVVMHAWDTGTEAAYPGWYRAVEYIPRARAIGELVLPGLLAAVRASDLPLFHVVGGGDYYKDCPGYHRAVELAGPAEVGLEQVESDPVLERLRAFRREKGFVGAHNAEDVKRGSAALDFMPQARPEGAEGVVLVVIAGVSSAMTYKSDRMPDGVLEVTDPETPDYAEFEIRGQLAYMTTSKGGLAVEKEDEPGTWHQRFEMELHGDHLYLGTYDELVVVDVQDQHAMRELTRFGIESYQDYQLYNRPRFLAAAGDRLHGDRLYVGVSPRDIDRGPSAPYGQRSTSYLVAEHRAIFDSIREQLYDQGHIRQSHGAGDGRGSRHWPGYLPDAGREWSQGRHQLSEQY